MMAGRIRVPIRLRMRRKAGGGKWNDPLLKRMTKSVMILCLGFFLIMVGVLLTIMGTNTKTRSAKQGDVEPMIILGPIFLLVGTLASIGGGVGYGINYTKKTERDKQLARTRTSSTKVAVANGDPDAVPAQTSSNSKPSYHEDEFDDIEYAVAYTTSSVQTSPMHHGVDV